MPKSEAIAIRGAEIIETFDDVVKLAEIVSQSKMFPDVQTAAQAVVKIIAGRELGIPAMASLRGMHVIKGKAEVGAGLLAAMIKASGKYDYTVVTSDDNQCVLAWRENIGGAQTLVGRSVFTLEDAKRAKLIKPDSNWERFPRAMLFARAFTEGQRRYAPDVAIGAVYAMGEINEVADIEDLTLAHDEKVIQAEAVTVETAPPEMSMLEVSNMLNRVADACHVLKDEHGVPWSKIKGKIERLTGHEFQSPKDLSEDEAAKVYKALENWASDLSSQSQQSVVNRN